MKRAILTTVCGLAIAPLGCTHHTVEVRPIHMTVDVNIKVDRELDRFFAFEEEMAAAHTDPAPAAEPAEGVAP